MLFIQGKHKHNQYNTVLKIRKMKINWSADLEDYAAFVFVVIPHSAGLWLVRFLRSGKNPHEPNPQHF